MNAKSIGLPDDVQDYLLAGASARRRSSPACARRPPATRGPDADRARAGRAVRAPRRAPRRAAVPRGRHVHRLLVARRRARDAARRPAGLLRRLGGVHGDARRYWAEAGVADGSTCGSRPRSTRWTRCSPRAGGHVRPRVHRRGQERYPDYYERCVELVRPGGLIALDNVLWSGEVADPRVDDQDTQTLREVNETIAGDDACTT